MFPSTSPKLVKNGCEDWNNARMGDAVAHVSIPLLVVRLELGKRLLSRNWAIGLDLQRSTSCVVPTNLGLDVFVCCNHLFVVPSTRPRHQVTTSSLAIEQRSKIITATVKS